HPVFVRLAVRTAHAAGFSASVPGSGLAALTCGATTIRGTGAHSSSPTACVSNTKSPIPPALPVPAGSSARRIPRATPARPRSLPEAEAREDAVEDVLGRAASADRVEGRERAGEVRGDQFLVLAGRPARARRRERLGRPVEPVMPAAQA